MERRVYLAALDRLGFVATRFKLCKSRSQVLQAINPPEAFRRKL
jgi:hypothetical protein